MNVLPMILGALVGGPAGALLGQMLVPGTSMPKYQPQTPPNLGDASVQAAAQAARKAAQEAKGRGSTILTGGGGVDNSTLQTSRKATLGA